jgi:protein-disulfide isomerase/uncharacterized membrane protein
MGVRPWRVLSAVLLVVGLLLSAALLARTFALLAEQSPRRWDVCTALFGGNCDATMLGASASQLGIPWAGWGLVLYSVLASLLVLGRVLRGEFERDATLAALLVALSAGVVSVVLLASMLRGAAPWCPLCVAVHAVNLALIPALKLQSGGTVAELGHRLWSGGRYLMGAAAPPETTWKAAVFLVPSLVGVTAYQWVLVECVQRSSTARAQVTPEVVIRSFESQPEREIPVGANDPALGPDDAPVQLIVFSSFPCGGCRQLAQELKFLDEHFRGKLRIVFKHFPLSPSCNPRVKADKQPRACAAAAFAEAAHRQGRFWDVHHALFAAADLSDERLVDISQQAGLNSSQLLKDTHDPRTLEKVRADAELGTYVGVTATPTVYLNGRFVENLSSGVLDILIHDLLGEQEQAGHRH